MNTLYKVALVIGVIGCINWGLVGILNFNLVEFLFGFLSRDSSIMKCVMDLLTYN